MKFSVCNLGCKVNAYEAESIAAILENKGWQRVGFEESADAALIFTCAVTNTAAAKSRKMLHRVRRNNPKCVTAVVGCYAQIQDGGLVDADIILGSREKKKLPEYLFQYLETHEKIVKVDDLSGAPFEPLLADSFENHARAYLKIQDGCNQFCSYCVIPFARGRERSMEPDMVIQEISRIAENYSEVVLTGIHTGRYGKEYGVTLAGLMERILKETSIGRIRISSIEVTEVSDELIALMEEEPERIARNLHIPLQSGNDEVLKAMHRPYTTEQYYNRIEYIRKRLKDVSISCDLITGFPEESQFQHEEAMEFVKKCGFAFLHVFPYSEREGTLAVKMKQVPVPVRKERARQMIALSEQLRLSYEEKQIGKEAVIVAETYSEGYTEGYTSDYISVKTEGKIPHGTMCRVILDSIQNGQIYARKV